MRAGSEVRTRTRKQPALIPKAPQRLPAADGAPAWLAQRSMRRARALIRLIEEAWAGERSERRDTEIGDTDEDELRRNAGECGVFLNHHTLEVDLFNFGFEGEIITTLRERRFSQQRQHLIDRWELNPSELDATAYLGIVDAIGKGRFAQRLASRIRGSGPHSRMLRQCAQSCTTAPRAPRTSAECYLELRDDRMVSKGRRCGTIARRRRVRCHTYKWTNLSLLAPRPPPRSRRLRGVRTSAL